MSVLFYFRVEIFLSFSFFVVEEEKKKKKTRNERNARLSFFFRHHFFPLFTKKTEKTKKTRLRSSKESMWSLLGLAPPQRSPVRQQQQQSPGTSASRQRPEFSLAELRRVHGVLLVRECLSSISSSSFFFQSSTSTSSVVPSSFLDTSCLIYHLATLPPGPKKHKKKLQTNRPTAS